MIRSRDFCTLARRMLDEKWGYILNAYGQFWTEKDQANTTDSMARQYGRQWIGRRVIDCSGIGYLIFTLMGQKMAHGSNSMWDSWVNDRCELKNGKRADGKEMWPGDPVFRKEQREKQTDRLDAVRCDIVARDVHGQPSDVFYRRCDRVSRQHALVVAVIDDGAVLAYPRPRDHFVSPERDLIEHYLFQKFTVQFSYFKHSLYRTFP